jgi:antitoxin component YwqK of YwqJK toxin-antitoxin module
MRNPITAIGILCLVYFSPSAAFAQISGEQHVKWIDSRELINDGIKLNDDEDYAKAIEKYKQINRNDSLYTTALYELAVSYYSNKEYDKAIEACKEGVKIKSENLTQFYNVYASALDKADKGDEALAVFDEAIKLCPLNTTLLINKGITLRHMHRDADAVELFQKAIKMNPFYASAHYYLGMTAVWNGKFVPGILSLETFLLLEHGTQRAVDALVMLETVSKGDYEIKPDSIVEFHESPGDFASIETLIKSKISLSSDYELQVKTKYGFVKPVQMVFEKLKYKASDKGFWMQFYVPMFTKMWEDKQFKPYVYYILGNLNDDDAQRDYKKNEGSIKEMLTSAGAYITSLNKKGPDIENYPYKGMPHWYSDGALVGVGNMSPDGEARAGHWYFFFENGALRASGNYVNSKKEGVWEYYNSNGTLSSKEEMKADLLDGISYDYFENGATSYKITYKAGQTDGEAIAYYPTGQKKTIMQFKDGKKQGPSTEYHENGNKENEVTYKDNVMTGPIKVYYESGELEYEVSYKDGMWDGPYKSYYKNGATETTGNYVAGKQEGEFLTYYENKNLKSKENYKGGYYNGIQTDYYDDGKTKSEEKEYKEGSATRLSYYDRDGKLFNELNFKNDKLIKVSNFDKSGKPFAVAENNKGDMAIEFYYPGGQKKSEGKSQKSMREGTWKFYFIDGQVETEEPYTKGEVEGVRKDYYANGKLYEEAEYKGDKYDGYCKRYYKNGQLHSEGFYKEGLKEGEWLTYFADGNLQTREYYVNDEQKGYQTYYHPDGSIDREEYIEEGFFNGFTQYRDKSKPEFKTALDKGNGIVSEPFFKNDKVYGKYAYANGLLQGPFESYFPDGKTREKAEYKNGFKEGTDVFYFPDGKKESEGNYVHGQREGMWTWYHENGQKELEANFLHGDYHGPRTWYYASGKKEIDGDYKYDEPVGYQNYYAPDGTLRIRLKFDDEGKLVAYSYLDKEGKMLPDVAVVNQSAKITAYFPNGNKSAEMEYKNNFREGKYVLYNVNGKPGVVRTYNCGEEEGTVTQYNEDGTLYKEETYTNGTLNGPSKFYNEKGKLIRECAYLMGDKHGVEKVYGADGKLLESHEYAYDIRQN